MDKPIIMCPDMVRASLPNYPGEKRRFMRVIKDRCLQSIPFDEISPVMNTPPHQHDSYDGDWYYELQSKVDDTEHFKLKPSYQVGDRLYVKEGYKFSQENVDARTNGVFYVSHYGNYLADGEAFDVTLTNREYKLWKCRKHPYRKTSGRFMYKSLARIFMPITRITVQRPKDLSEEECIAEGIYGHDVQVGKHYNPHTIYAAFPEKGGGFKTAREAFELLWDSLYGEGAYERNEWCFVYWWEEIEVN